MVIRAWVRTEEGMKRRGLPQEWKNARLEAVAGLTTMWLQFKSFGLSLTLQDAIIEEEQEAQCPFL